MTFPARKLALFATAALALLLPSCSLIVDKSADQCTSNAECKSFPGTTCQAGICAAPAVSCSTNQQCADQHDKDFICRKSDHTCVSLRSNECTTVYNNPGPYLDDSAFIFGSVLPIGGSPATGEAIENAIKLAIDEFSHGIPIRDGQPHPLVLVGCDENTEEDTMVLAARHLCDEVEVSAIIGGAFSGNTDKMVNAIKGKNVLTISPSATSIRLTNINSPLFWRTAPSDVHQAAALALFTGEEETGVRGALGLADTDAIKVAIAYKGDAYGTDLTTEVLKKLVVNKKPALDDFNKPNVKDFNYGEKDPAKYETTVDKVVAFAPHIILLFGTDESIKSILAPLEDKWSSPYKPRYVLSDGGLVPALSTAVKDKDELRARIRGSVPGAGAEDALFKSFAATYEAKEYGTSVKVFGVAGAYDATYLLAYAAVALGNSPIHGKDLAGAFGRMVPPNQPILDVGVAKINNAIDLLANGNSFDFNGASGPLDFDLPTGEAASDIQLWCLPKNQDDTDLDVQFTGRSYDAATGKLTGDSTNTCD